MKTAHKAAFTLVELMVVIGLMALLGSISVTGYFAAVRGMSDRGALDDTRSIIRLAMQTCLIDQTPTAVLFYNHQNQVADGERVSKEEVRATSSGSAVAIKMAGRVSFMNDKALVDEFADWNQSYPVKDSDSPSKIGVRFYRMTDLSAIEKGIDSCSSIMNDYVKPVHDVFDSEYMIAAGCQVYQFCEKFKKKATDNKKTSYLNGNNYRFGLGFKEKNGISWEVGDAYGVEIATLDLPKGYIFGTQEPDSMKISGGQAVTFTPEAVSGWDKYEFSNMKSVTISAFRGEAFKSIGTLSAEKLRDDR